jgi:Family of unknown function (DUF6335)
MPAIKKAKKQASKKKLSIAKKAAKKTGKKKATKKVATKPKKVASQKAKKLTSKKKVVSAKSSAKTSAKKSVKKAVRKKRATAKKPKPALTQKPVIEASESHFVDAGRLETEIYEPDPEVKGEFAEAAVLGDPSRRVLLDELRENSPAESPVVSGGDIDAAWDQSDASGEETVGGSNPTPDQDIVDELGKAVGLTYQNNEPLDTEEKVSERDRNRWELEPESSEDFDERNNG